MTESSDATPCRNCDEPVPTGARFCPSCGAQLNHRPLHPEAPGTEKPAETGQLGPWARMRAAVPLSRPLVAGLAAVVVAAVVVGLLLATKSTPVSVRSAHLSTPPSVAPASSAFPTTPVSATTLASPTTSVSTVPPTSIPASTTTIAVAALPHVYSQGCPGEFPGTFEPTEIPLACADYDANISGITWSSWTLDRARGAGTLNVNDCTPDCAGGTFHHTPTSVTLSNPVRSRTQGLIFATVTFVMPDGSSHSQDIGPSGCATNSYVHYC